MYPLIAANLSREYPKPQGRAGRLATFATRALIEEAELTPKPALVDKRGPGAHADLSLTLMKRSARSLRPHFERMALVSVDLVPNQILREQLGAIGRSAERTMLSVTEGVNTHRGAIWALGLLVSAAAMETSTPNLVADRAGQLARLTDSQVPKQQLSNGARVIERYQVAGARAEAQAGFPHVTAVGLPRLYRSRQQGATETKARLDTLLAIMMSLEDTCLLHRGGRTALKAAQAAAAAILAAGGTATVPGWDLLQRLDRELVALRASPGGSADLLAATLFLDLIAKTSSVPN
jgi:triphosphoribosyl-dephospho-CoA synthase